MAEFIFRDMVKKGEIADRFVIKSSATSTEEIWNGIGNPVYPPAKRELAKHGIGCDGKRAVQLKKSDYDKYDYFICMDSNNIRNTMRIFGDDKDGKVCKMMSFAGMNRDVSDPWYSGDFEQAYNDIYSGCKGLFEKFKGKTVLIQYFTLMEFQTITIYKPIFQRLVHHIPVCFYCRTWL